MSTYTDRFGSEYWVDMIGEEEPRYTTFVRDADWLPGLRRQTGLSERPTKAEAEADLAAFVDRETWRGLTLKEESKC